MYSAVQQIAEHTDPEWTKIFVRRYNSNPTPATQCLLLRGHASIRSNNAIHSFRNKETHEAKAYQTSSDTPKPGEAFNVLTRDQTTTS